MRFTVIPEDGTIVLGGRPFTEIGFAERGITMPDDVHALQWDGANGHIEYKESSRPNEAIDLLPQWAMECWELHAVLAHEEDNPPPPPPMTTEEILEEVVRLRNSFLFDTDFIMLPDSPFSDTDRTAWGLYRQELRDLPMREGYPWDGVYNYTNWPQPHTTGVVNEPTLNTAPREWYNDNI